MSEAILAAIIFVVLFYAPALLTIPWSQPLLLSWLLALGCLPGLVVGGWIVATYLWRSQSGPPRLARDLPRPPHRAPRP